MDDRLYENYLAHYGVIGMKWGVRRARKLGAKSAKTSERAKRFKEEAGRSTSAKKQKKLYKKSEELSAKSKKQKIRSDKKLSYHTKRGGGKKAVAKVERESWLKTGAKSFIMGTYGALNYNKMRSTKGYGRVASAGAAFASNWANNLTGGLVSVAEPRIGGFDAGVPTKGQVKSKVSNIRKKK